MMNDRINSEQNRERLSALMDGELSGDDAMDALKAACRDDGAMTWYTYHVVGDVLRSSELAPGAADNALLNAVRDRLAQEAQARPKLLEPQESLARPMPEAANASVFRWKMVAGLASVAAVAAVGWGVFSAVPGGAGGAQLAVAPPAAAAASNTSIASPPVVASVDADQTGPVMIRDPRLDELLAAHRQFGATSNLQMPAGFLRNATFEDSAR